MQYDSAPALCPDCSIEAPADADVMIYLDEYARALPDGVRASGAAYAARLEICAACEHRQRFTCVLCGCYVQARAAKARMRCPLPGAPKWLEEIS